MALIDISLPQSIAKALRFAGTFAQEATYKGNGEVKLKKARFTEFGQAPTGLMKWLLVNMPVKIPA